MQIKELIDELGGGRSVSLGAVLVMCCYVAANRYVETVEERLADLTRRVVALEKHDIEAQARREYQGRPSASLEDRLEKLERGRER